MGFQIVITRHFKKHYLNKGIVTKEAIFEKAREIENSIFYFGEGRLAGSRMIYKKRFRLKGTSKRRGGRILILLFHKTENIYVPHSAWLANDSRKQRKDQELKSEKEMRKIFQETILFMNEK